jgi:hypothetical protein
MTKEVFHKLISLTFDLDMMPDIEREPMIHQLGATVLQSVVLRAVQSIDENDLARVQDRLTATQPDQVLTSVSELFPDSDIWIQEEVRKLHDEFLQ